MKKKKLFIIALCLLAVSQIFADPIGLFEKPKEPQASNYTIFDTPLLSGIEYFINTFSAFSVVAGYLAIILGLTGVLWNAFRLWFGTQQVRKACIDIGLKFLTYTCVLMIYGSVVSGVMTFSTNLGLYAGNGYYNTRLTMNNMYVNLKNETKAASDALEKYYKATAAAGKVITDDTVKLLAKNTGYTTDEIMEKVKAESIEFRETMNLTAVGKQVGAAGGAAAGVAIGAAIGTAIPVVGNIVGGLIGGLVGSIAGWFGGSKAGSAIENYSATSAVFSNAMNIQEMVMLGKILQGDYRDEFRLMKALDEVITPVTNEDGTISYIYDPVIELKGTTGTPLKILSPGAIIKTGILWASLIKSIESQDYISESETFVERKIDEGFNSLTSWLMQMILILGINFSMIFATIQYVLAVFEYFIVTSMGVIFIPCILFDGTKTYASKLIMLFLSFFVKITVTIMCLFFVVNMFSASASVIISSGHPCSMANFAFLLFTIFLGFILTQNAPKVAMTMLNGNPELSMGEFLHAAASIGFGARLGARASDFAHKKAAPVVKGANAGIAEGAAAAAGAWKGAGEAGAGFGTKFKMAAGAGFKQTASAWSSGIKDYKSRLLTGKESSSHNASSLHSGVGNIKQIHGGETLTEEQRNKAGNNGEVNNNVISSINQNRAKQAVEAQKAKTTNNNSSDSEQPGKVSISGDSQKRDSE